MPHAHRVLFEDPLRSWKVCRSRFRMTRHLVAEWASGAPAQGAGMLSYGGTVCDSGVRVYELGRTRKQKVCVYVFLRELVSKCSQIYMVISSHSLWILTRACARKYYMLVGKLASVQQQSLTTPSKFPNVPPSPQHG